MECKKPFNIFYNEEMGLELAKKIIKKETFCQRSLLRD